MLPRVELLKMIGAFKAENEDTSTVLNKRSSDTTPPLHSLLLYVVETFDL